MSGRAATTGVIPGRFGLSVGKPDIEPPQGWRWTKLTDVARLETGHTPSRRKPAYWDGDVPWIGIKDARLFHGRVIPDTIQHTTPLGIENSAARVLPAETVCLSRTASIGYVTMMGQPMATSQDFVNWVCSGELDPKFLMSLLIAESDSLNYFSHGSTHQTIYFPEVKAFHVCLPSIEEQRRIAAVLGALDDRIEVNRRMNRTLEAMAQALFRRQFVDFDGRDDLVEHEAGPLPEGWKRTHLGRVIEIRDRLRVPLSKKERRERPGDYPYHGATSVMDYVDDYLFEGVHVLVGEDGSVTDALDRPVTQYVWGKFWVNNHAHVLRGKPPISNEHLLLALRESNVRPFITGAVQAKLNQRNLKKVPFLLPSKEACADFNRAIQPLYARIRQGVEQSRTLTDLRNVLLPKLVSGELRVPEAEEAVEDAL